MPDYQPFPPQIKPTKKPANSWPYRLKKNAKSLLRLGLLLLLQPLTAQYAGHGVVAFVAGVFKDALVVAGEGHFAAPGLAVIVGVGDGEFVEQSFIADAGETLDDFAFF